MNAPVNPGFFGKIPSHGDFITRRVPRTFLDPWDAWMQQALSTSKEQLGSSWLDFYLTSPIWRFVLSKGVFCDRAFAGILMPSVDKVGRYFPLTLTCILPKNCNPMQLPHYMDDWFDQAEIVALKSLEEPFNLDDFDRHVENLDIPVPTSDFSQSSATNIGIQHKSGQATYLNLSSNKDVTGPFINLLNQLLNTTHGCYSVWWSAGSERVLPSMIISKGMPPYDGYSAFLDGKWSKWGWQAEGGLAATPVEPEVYQGPLIPENAPDPEEVKKAEKEKNEPQGNPNYIPADWEYPL